MKGYSSYGFLGLSIIAIMKKIGSHTWRVKSQSGNKSYLVIKDGSEWRCECPDHQFRGVICKHIHAVMLKLSLMDSKEIMKPMSRFKKAPDVNTVALMKL